MTEPNRMDWASVEGVGVHITRCTRPRARRPASRSAHPGAGGDREYEKANGAPPCRATAHRGSRCHKGKRRDPPAHRSINLRRTHESQTALPTRRVHYRNLAPCLAKTVCVPSVKHQRTQLPTHRPPHARRRRR
jgi:hypothetical protein